MISENHRVGDINTNNYSFNKIDTKNKAYILGFLLATTIINHSKCMIDAPMNDKEVVEFIGSIIGATPRYSYKYDKKKRIFPSVRVDKKITDITQFTGGEKKADRHYPRVPKDFERYLLLGFFDGDGTISWGRRKDRNRIWHKISFKSSLSILTGLQNMLLNTLDIATVVHPVRNENVYVLEFAGRKNVLKFLSYIYPDNSFVILRRKYMNQNALRLELGENGESPVEGQYRVEYTEYKDVETNGDVAAHLNNHSSPQVVLNNKI